jgi:hypothetical protein
MPLTILVETLSRDLAGTGIKIQVIDPDLGKSLSDDLAVSQAADAILRGLRSDNVTVGGAKKPSSRWPIWLKRLFPK